LNLFFTQKHHAYDKNATKPYIMYRIILFIQNSCHTQINLEYFIKMIKKYLF
jgi:hypothetical protein